MTSPIFSTVYYPQLWHRLTCWLRPKSRPTYQSTPSPPCEWHVINVSSQYCSAAVLTTDVAHNWQQEWDATNQPHAADTWPQHHRHAYLKVVNEQTNPIKTGIRLLIVEVYMRTCNRNRDDLDNGFHKKKCWPSHSRPLSIQLTQFTATATAGGKCWDPHISQPPTFEGKKTAQNFVDL